MTVKYDSILGNIREDDSDPYFKGWYSTPVALRAALPTSTDGTYAIVGSTDTIWVWDSDINDWSDTGLHGLVTSVFGRTTDVLAQAGDYSAFYDALGTASGLMGTHLSSFIHSDISANTAARHARLHDLDSTSDHGGIAGSTGNFMALNASGLPVDSGANIGYFDDQIDYLSAAITGNTSAIENITGNIDFLSGSIDNLSGSSILNDSIISGSSLTDALDWINANKVGNDTLQVYTIGTLGSGANYECTGTDDHLVFAAAVAAVPSGSELLVMMGTYKFSGTVTVNTPITFKGTDRTATIIEMQTNATAFLFNDGATGSTLEHLKFQPKSGLSYTAYMVNFLAASSLVDSCWFETGYDQLYFGGSLGIVSRNYFHYGNVALTWNNGINVIIEKNTFENPTYGIKAVNGAYAVIQNNVFYAGTYGLYLGKNSYAVTNVKIIANHFKNLNCGIYMESSLNGASPNPNSMCNNNISKNSFETGWFCWGGEKSCIVLLGAHNNSVEGNIFSAGDGTHTSNALIYLGSGYDGSHCDGNTFNDNVGDAIYSNYAFNEINSNQTNNTLLGNRWTAGLSGTIVIAGSGSIDRDALLESIPDSLSSKLNEANLSGNVHCDIIPQLNSVYSLGTSAYQWKDVYVTSGSIYLQNHPLGLNVAQNITFDGDELAYQNEIDAVSAAVTGNTADIAALCGDWSHGDTLELVFSPTNYTATDTTLSSHLNGIDGKFLTVTNGLSAYVDKTNAQTIAGIKSFSNTLSANAGANIAGILNIGTFSIDSETTKQFTLPDDSILPLGAASEGTFILQAYDGNLYGTNDSGVTKLFGTGTGDVSGPSGNTANYIPQWNGADSKLLKDGINPATLALVADLNVVSAAVTGNTADITAISGTYSYLDIADISFAPNVYDNSNSSLSGHLQGIDNEFNTLVTGGIFFNGLSGGRPASPVVGYMYFDTSLGLPIWFLSGSTWVNATGASV